MIDYIQKYNEYSSQIGLKHPNKSTEHDISSFMQMEIKERFNMTEDETQEMFDGNTKYRVINAFARELVEMLMENTKN